MKRVSAAIVLGCVVSTSAARAEPARGRATVGVSVGRVESASDGDGTDVDQSTSNVFGRLRIGSGVSLQLELGRATLAPGVSSSSCGFTGCDDPYPGWATRRLALGVRYDLRGGAARLVPFVVGALVRERWDQGIATHDVGARELGVGVELRLTSTIALGLELRRGARRLDGTRIDDGVATLVPVTPPFQIDDHYRATRLTLSMRL